MNVIRPPFTLETATAKVRTAEDAWNSRDPIRVANAYSEDSVWRNRNVFLVGRDEIRMFLAGKWARELDAGADDVGFVEIGRPALDDQRQDILKAFPLTRTLISFVVRMNREVAETALWKFHRAGPSTISKVLPAGGLTR